MFNLIRRRGRKAPAGRARPGLEALEDRCVPSNSATFLGTDSTTQGSWQGAYGGAGYAIAGDATSLPSQYKVTVSGNSTYVYANSTDNLRGLQKAATPGTRVEAGWFNYVYGVPTTSFNVEVKGPGSPTRVSFYVEDWDGGNRAETITASDAKNGTILDTESVSNFRDGKYLSWDVEGDVVFTFTKTSGPSAEVSAVFLGGASTPPAAGGSAAFAGSDSTTNGNWQGVYGAEGYNVYGAAAAYPAYAAVSSYGGSVGAYTFAASTADPRGLQKPATPTDRIAVAQYGNSFTLDVNLTDGLTHKVSLYAADWDKVGRVERFDVIDNTTGAVLDTETLTDFATTGKYLSWNLSGHVQIRVTSLSSTGQNAVVEGVFFDPAPPVMGAAVALSAPSTAAAAVAPQGGAANGPAFAPPGLLNGVDVVLLDRLFASGQHVQSSDFGTFGLTEGMA